MAVELQPMGAKGPEDPVTPSKQARRTNSIEEELSFENIVNNRCLSVSLFHATFGAASSNTAS